MYTKLTATSTPGNHCSKIEVETKLTTTGQQEKHCSAVLLLINGQQACQGKFVFAKPLRLRNRPNKARRSLPALLFYICTSHGIVYSIRFIPSTTSMCCVNVSKCEFATRRGARNTQAYSWQQYFNLIVAKLTCRVAGVAGWVVLVSVCTPRKLVLAVRVCRVFERLRVLAQKSTRVHTVGNHIKKAVRVRGCSNECCCRGGRERGSPNGLTRQMEGSPTVDALHCRRAKF